jgi:hypothetical protein
MTLSESYKRRLKVLSGIIFESTWPYDKFIKKTNPYTYPKVPANNIFSHPVQVVPREVRALADKHIDDNTFENIAPIEDVNVKDLIPTQKVVTAYNLESAYKSQDIPYVLEYNRQYFILDGHHRLANEILDGKEKSKAHVFHVHH